MFAEIAPRYDFVNRMLSGGIDIWWRRITVKRAPPPTTGAILDVCTGTGDLALAYAVKAGPSVRVVGSDFCKPMLDRGIEKSATRNVPVEWLEADAMKLPFPDNSFDLVTVAFGLRNIAEDRHGAYRNVPRLQARRATCHSRILTARKRDHSQKLSVVF